MKRHCDREFFIRMEFSNVDIGFYFKNSMKTSNCFNKYVGLGTRFNIKLLYSLQCTQSLKKSVNDLLRTLNTIFLGQKIQLTKNKITTVSRVNKYRRILAKNAFFHNPSHKFQNHTSPLINGRLFFR